MTDDRDAVPANGRGPEPEATDATAAPAAPERDATATGPAAEGATFAGPEADTDEAVVPEGAGASAAAPATTSRPMRPAERRAARAKPVAAAPTPSERLVHIEDRASRWFVLASIAVFTLILLRALLLGQGGFLAADPTPSPAASASPAASPGGSPSGSPAPSGSAEGSPSGAASPGGSGGTGSPGANGSAAPSTSPAPGPS